MRTSLVIALVGCGAAVLAAPAPSLDQTTLTLSSFAAPIQRICGAHSSPLDKRQTSRQNELIQAYQLFLYEAGATQSTAIATCKAECEPYANSMFSCASEVTYENVARCSCAGDTFSLAQDCANCLGEPYNGQVDSFKELCTAVGIEPGDSSSSSSSASAASSTALSGSSPTASAAVDAATPTTTSGGGNGATELKASGALAVLGAAAVVLAL
ncbi:hypothetical protein JCM6882_002409 [Rhodosporidiobolus microsporus]